MREIRVGELSIEKVQAAVKGTIARQEAAAMEAAQ